MALSFAESTNPDKVFAEVQEMYQAQGKNWTINDFTAEWEQASEEFYLKLKTLSTLRVALKYEGGKVRVYLQGEKDKEHGSGWTEHWVASLPGQL
jgi:hypothetical protein